MNDEVKEIAKEAFRRGYILGYGVENLDELDKKVIKSRFERWWDINVDEDEEENVAVDPDLVNTIADNIARDAETAFIPMTAIDEGEMPEHLPETASQARWDEVRRMVTAELRDRGFSIT